MATIDKTTMLNIGQGGDPVPVALGGDLSANRASTDIFVGKPAGGKVRVVFLVPTSVGAARPTGQFWVKVNGTPDSAGYLPIEQCDTAAAGYATKWAAVVAAQPSGDGAAIVLDFDNIETKGPFLQCGYDATSGGAGVVPSCYVYA